MYLKSQDRFADYNFEGSNFNVLLDILALNSYHNAFMTSMAGNEMFLDTAQLRDSVISHAKDLNYTPRSFKSAQANVVISVTTSDPNKTSILIPKGTTFTSRFGTKNYTFSTDENINISDFNVNPSSSLTFVSNNINLYEGYYVTDTFLYNYAAPQRFIITNSNIDTSSLSVTVIEDMGANVLTYSQTQSLFDINSESQVFFIQGAENFTYEVTFGDGISGRIPKDNSTIIIEYRICNGELPNGCSSFVPDSIIDGESNVIVTTTAKASSGSVSEDIESIRFNAPKHFATQERAITSSDYETLLKQAFPEINAVTAFGGEELNPPQFGKVMVSVDLNEIDGLPTIKKDQYYNFLKSRSTVSMEPVFVDPEYMYILVDTTVSYNINVTNLTINDIKTIVSSSILSYANSKLNNFKKTFRYSNLLKAIDSSQSSIVSNLTNVKAIKVINPVLSKYLTFDVKYGITLESYASSNDVDVISSSVFTYNGQQARLKDSNGKLQVVSSLNGNLIDIVGTINYAQGLLQFSNFKVESYVGSGIKIYSVPINNDISTLNNVILNIVEDDVVIKVLPVKE